MKKYIYKSFIIIIITGFTLTGCQQDFLETAPTRSVSADKAIETTSNAKIALNGVHRLLYIRLNSDASQRFTGIGAVYMDIDALGDDMVMHADRHYVGFYRWISQHDLFSYDHVYPWRFFYRIISNVNNIINNIENATGPQSEKDAILGQALTYRAFAHYELVQLYGKRYLPGGNNTQLGIPVKTRSGAEDAETPRATVEEVYVQINEDIDQAILLLEEHSIASNASHISPNVAMGIKARIALTQAKWDVAATMARKARVGYGLMSAATYADGFRDGSSSTNPEFMWGSLILTEHTDRFGNFGAYMSRNFSSNNVRNNPRSINSNLYDLIADTDVRKGLWAPTGQHLNLPEGISLLSTHRRRPYTNQKFIAIGTGDSRMDVPHMRVAEMYLIEAEALARGGSGDPAQVLYDLVSTRDAAYTKSSNTGQALIDEIMAHRRVELWGEGFRFLDIKRLNQPLDRTGANHNDDIARGLFTVPVDDIRWEWLIPEDEINANPNMLQNPK